MAFSTYTLRCADNSCYTGHTDDLNRRFAQHQSGEVRGYTFERRPVELVWAERFQTGKDALAAELRIKNWSHPKKQAALIAVDWEPLSRLSRSPAERGLARARHNPRLRSR
jgi:tRNA/rRNA methyltransferase